MGILARIKSAPRHLEAKLVRSNEVISCRVLYLPTGQWSGFCSGVEAGEREDPTYEERSDEHLISGGDYDPAAACVGRLR